jgi:hypothetical protein
MHEVLLCLVGIQIKRDIFAFLIELRMRRGYQALGQGGFTLKLVRKLPCRKHGLRVRSGCAGETCIERQSGRAGLRPGLIRQV